MCFRCGFIDMISFCRLDFVLCEKFGVLFVCFVRIEVGGGEKI